jgi:uncharacterized protein YdhG (YjbR/CyaY superfamily)
VGVIEQELRSAIAPPDVESSHQLAKRQEVPMSTTKTTKKGPKFTAEERAAMKARAQEQKAEASESDVLAKIAKMQPSDRAMGEKVHEIVRSVAPDLTPRTWYGMPAYARDDKVICYFKDAAKFKTRYATVGFSERANLDDGNMWPIEYALTKLGPTEEKKIRALVKQAVS